MRKTLVLHSHLWATVLMLVMFVVSTLTGSRTPGGQELLSGPRYLQGKVIVLDPGHGGGDPGTVGVGPSSEAENVLAVAWELKGMLERAGAKVIMTRSSDQSPAWGTVYAEKENGQLAVRVAAANRSSGQIFISLHNDWHEMCIRDRIWSGSMLASSRKSKTIPGQKTSRCAPLTWAHRAPIPSSAVPQMWVLGRRCPWPWKEQCCRGDWPSDPRKSGACSPLSLIHI